MFANYLPVGIYTTNTPEACQYVAENSECELVVVEDKIQLDKFLQIWENLPQLKYVVIYNEPKPSNLPTKYMV
jgi:long-chain-fatty-acid--CoA ligase ACSBG